MILHRLLLLTVCAVLVSSVADAQTPGRCSPVPTTMRAARIRAAGGPEALVVERIAVPQPGPGQILVRVHFASINPVDWKRQESGDLRFPATPGDDFAGEIVALGPGVTTWTCGDEVAGIADPDGAGGSYAEYVAVPLDAVVRKPPTYSMAEAAAYPTVSIAAWRFLVADAKVRPGERVLVHGGAGGVGSAVVQLAKAAGAHVTATASARNHDYLREIGADVTIDYTTTRFEDVVRDIDVVVDTAGGDTTTRSAAVLRAGGRLVSPAGGVPPSLCAGARFTCPELAPWDVQGGLAYVAPIIASGQLRMNIDATYPLDAVVAAQQHSRGGRTRGKVVVDMGARASRDVLVPLQAYLDGHATGLERHFRRAFAADAILVGIKDGAYRQYPASDYITASASGRAPADESRRRRTITGLTVTGRVATAVIELEYPDMVASDHMTLVERDGEWRIVVKAYDATTPVAAKSGR
jgi:NADPH:quinone reductase-like Zn-dependent oxidoreductase